MSRPQTQRGRTAHYWPKDKPNGDNTAMALLVWAANKTMQSIGKTGYVERDDLVNEAWLRSVRYSNDARLVLQGVFLRRHMWHAYKRLSRCHPYSKRQVMFCGLDDIIEMPDSGSNEPMQSLLLVDEMRAVCDSREWEIVLRRLAGDTLKETGKHVGLSGERVRQLLVELRRKYDGDEREC